MNENSEREMLRDSEKEREQWKCTFDYKKRMPDPKEKNT